MISEIFWMDGNGPFVWGSWLVGSLLLTGCLAIALYRDRRIVRQIEGMARARPTTDGT